MQPKQPEKLSYATPDLPVWQRCIIRTIERVSGQSKLCRVYNDFLQRHTEPLNFWHDAAASLQLDINVCGNPALSIPATGGLLVVSNHPFGVVDGLALASLINQHRSDLKVIAWDVFCQSEHATEHLLPLDLAANNRSARKQNVALRREAVKYLQDGGCILLFPAGMLEVCDNPFSAPKEAPWTNFMASLALAAKVPVLPMFVHGHNSRLFNVVSQFSQTLRLALLFHETSRKIAGSVNIVVGGIFSTQQLASAGSHDEVTEQLRHATLELERLPLNHCLEIPATGMNTDFCYQKAAL